MKLYGHILLATDFSKGCHFTAKRAMEIAKETGARVSIIHAVEHLPSYAYSYLGSVDIETELVDEAKSTMAELGKELNIPESDQYIKVGSSKKLILDTAKELGVDLIIVGSHGRHGVSRLLGSTASAILHSAECDVLTIRFSD